MLNPLISIYMPTHNRVLLLQRAVQSVLNQTYKNFELIIVDDGSSDETWAYLQDLAERFCSIKCYRVDTPQGACNARNIAIQSAKGKYITGLDDDDEFKPDRLSQLLDAYQPDYAFVCTNFSEQKNGCQSVNEQMAKDIIRSSSTLIFQNTASNQIFTETYKLLAIGGFNINLKKLQDWDVWLRLSIQFGDFLKLASPSYIMHHDHEGPRVTNNMTYAKAVEALIEQNRSYYSEQELHQLTYLIKYFKNELKFIDILFNVTSFNDLILFKWYIFQTYKMLFK